jgi:DNA-binding transcriptional MerR regulator
MDTLHPDQKHSLDELSALVGLPKRTIRYYMGLGLVARPLGETKGAYYTAEHLQQLAQVKTLTESGVSLERIAALLARAGEPGLQQSPTPGQLTVKSHIHLAEGIELVINGAASTLTPEQIRAVAHAALQKITELKDKT